VLTVSQDLRNHGDSPHDRRHDYTSMAEDVEGFMNSHNMKKAILIGHSMLVYRVAINESFIC
jgi:hypothetical protein